MADKPKFDPNQPYQVAGAAKPKFDPNQAYQAAADPQQPGVQAIGDTGNGSQAALEGFGNGAAAGYLPSLQAATEPVFNKGHDIAARISNAIAGTNEPTNFSEGEPDYASRQKSWEAHQADLIKNNPKTYAGTGIAGGILMSPAPGLAFKAAGGAGLAARIAATMGKAGQAAEVAAPLGIDGLPSAAPATMYGGTPGKIAMAMTGAAGLGAISNPGQQTGDDGNLQLSKRIENAKNMAGNAGALNVGIRGLGKLGSNMFSSAIHPVEVAGEKYNKPDIVEEVNRQKVFWPPTMADKLQEAADRQMIEKGGIIDSATNAGGTIDVPKSLEPAQGYVDYLKKIGNQDHAPQVEAMQGRLDNLKTQAGKAADPYENVTGQSAPSTWQGDKWKTSSQSNVNWGAEQQKMQDQFEQALALGRKRAVEQSVSDAVGPEASQRLTELNASTGKILSTGKAQAKVQLQGQRDLNKILSPMPTKTETLAAALGQAASGEKGIARALQAWALTKAGRAADMMTMPTGYALKNYAPPVADALANNPWAAAPLYRGDKNGQ